MVCAARVSTISSRAKRPNQGMASAASDASSVSPIATASRCRYGARKPSSRETELRSLMARSAAADEELRPRTRQKYARFTVVREHGVGARAAYVAALAALQDAECVAGFRLDLEVAAEHRSQQSRHRVFTAGPAAFTQRHADDAVGGRLQQAELAHAGLAH